MRGNRWWTPILGGLLLLATGRDVSAQSAREGYVRLSGSTHTPTDVFGPTVRQSAWAPPPVAQSAGSAAGPITAPGMSPISTNPPGASGLPQNFQPWPGISPFDHQYSEHFVDRDGLWKWRGYNNRRRKYFLGIEYIQTSFKEPKLRRIGDPNTVSLSDDIIQPFTPPDPTDPTVTTDPPPQYFNGTFAPTNTRTAFTSESQPGTRVRWGYMDPQHQGFEATFWWTQDLNTDKVKGVPNPSLASLDDARILNPGLTVQDDTIDGINIIYDFGTHYRWKQQAYGGNISWIFSPIVHRGSLIVQPTLGGRIMRLREFFSMFGQGTGLDYTDDIITFPTGGGGGGNNNNNNTFDPDLGPDPGTTFPNPDTPPFYGLLRSDVRSILAGPEAGLRYQLGGDRFRLLGSTKFGLAANREIVKLSGQGIGSPQDLFNRFGPGSPNPDPTKLFDQSRKFAARQQHTHVTPMLEQAIFAEANIFGMVPVLNHMRLFKNAHFRTGYTFQVFWEVARPTDSIVYRGQPLDPIIRIDRSSIWIGNWSASVEWTY